VERGNFVLPRKLTVHARRQGDGGRPSVVAQAIRGNDFSGGVGYGGGELMQSSQMGLDADCFEARCVRPNSGYNREEIVI